MLASSAWCKAVWWILVSLMLVHSEPGIAMPFTIEAEADSHIRTDFDVRRNDNHGKQQYLEIGTSRGGGGIPFGGPDVMRALIRFDVSGDSTRLAQRAILQLTVQNFFGPPSTVFMVDVHRVLESGPLTPWIEGNGFEGPNSTTQGAPPGAVWVDAAFGVAWAGVEDDSSLDAANNHTQPNFDPTVVASARVDTGLTAIGDVIQWDITSLYNDWILAIAPNEGLLLRDVTTDRSFRTLRLGAREGNIFELDGAVDGPRLVISPIPAPEPKTIFLLGVGVGLLFYAHRRKTIGSRQSSD